jgi:alginate O-acetyltransferase complex protein AlgI
MIFPSSVFLFVFLPLILLLYFSSPKKLHNTVLLIASLVFYAWGEPIYVTVMLASVAINWALGFAVSEGTHKRKWLGLAVILNIGALVYFKYLGFLIHNFNDILSSDVSIPKIIMPLGVSFYTFHALSYVIDIYRKKSPVQKSFFQLALYLSLFPQLISGPIVRYSDIAYQFENRTVTLAGFLEGIRRFILGMGKKVLIANSVAILADRIFDNHSTALSPSAAWLGAIAYTVQIYYDFSGYSDMAIGLAKMFGFTFTENFNQPYHASSIKDFWRRWHISLSTWFRDYLFIPLGGSHCSQVRSYLNLLIVFALCGIWHGASWVFLVWGLYHGFFLILERTAFGKILENSNFFIQRSYAMIIVTVGWVFFRSPSLSTALSFLKKMFLEMPSFVLTHKSLMPTDVLLWDLLSYDVIVPLCVGIVIGLCRPNSLRSQFMFIVNKLGKWEQQISHAKQVVLWVGLFAMLLGSILRVVNETYNPFIYFRF